MNCVLLVGDQATREPAEISAAAAVAGAESDVLLFDSHFECADRCSAVTASMMTGMYPRVHGVGAGSASRRWAGPTLPGILRECGFDCLVVAPESVFSQQIPIVVECSGGGSPTEALDAWFARRAEPRRPFFAFLWDSRDAAPAVPVSGVLAVLGGRGLLADTAVVVVATRSRERPRLESLTPSPLPLGIILHGRPSRQSRFDRMTDTVDLFPTVLALTAGQSGDLPAPEPAPQGVALVEPGGAIARRSRSTVYAELGHEDLGVRCLVVRDARSTYAVLNLDESGGGWGRISAARLGALVVGPAWRRRLMLELLTRAAVERASGTRGPAPVGDDLAWGRSEVGRWAEACDSRALAIRRLAETKGDAALRARLRGLGYMA